MQSDNLKKFNNNTLTIFRRSISKDNYGGVGSEWDKKNWDIPCRLYDYRGTYIVDVEGSKFPVTHKMICDKATDLIEGDKVKDFKNDDEYLVLSVKKVYSMNEISHFECWLSRL